MAGPSKVEFPGKTRQRMRMRGTKQANKDTQKRLRKNLDRLLEEGETLLPAMVWEGRMSWGRTDPVTKTLRELNRILDRRHDKKYLAKRMMAKRGDAVAKAFAGSMMAAHDDEISIVGDYKHPSFGSASFVRRGDGKTAYQAGIQNYHVPKLRMLPWEDHARKGFHFFSWRGGFVCTGLDTTIPEGWLPDVLERSRFKFKNDDDVWYTSKLNASDVREGKMCGPGYVLMKFNDGSKVAIDFTTMTTEKDKTSFVHHLALSMMPPNLSGVLELDAAWAPDGYDLQVADGPPESVERVLDAWVGLTLNEGSVAKRVKIATLHHLDDGVIVGENWFAEAKDAVGALNGSNPEKELATILLENASGSSIRVSQRGEITEREGSAIEIAATSLNDVLSALWEEYGLEGLIALGLDEDEADALWVEQSKKMRPFGKFLRELDDARSKTSLTSVFPHKMGSLPGAVGLIHDLVMMGIIDGLGRAEKKAVSFKGDIESEASAWAFLVACNRSSGKEWQFSPDARDRGGAWGHAATGLWNSGKSLVAGEETNYQSELESLAVSCGQSGLF